MLGITNVSNAPSIVLKNTVVSDWTSGSYNGYSYRGAIPITGVTENMIAEVTFSQSQAESGNYSSVCTTYDGGLYIYAKVNTQITIPSIIIHSIVESYYQIDNYPTDGSTNAVSSGGVYNALTNVQPMGVTSTTSGKGIIQRYGKLVVVKIYGLSVTSTGQFQQSGITIPKPINHANCSLTSGTGALIGTAYADAGWTTISFHAVSTGTAYGTMVFFTND